MTSLFRAPTDGPKSMHITQCLSYAKIFNFLQPNCNDYIFKGQISIALINKVKFLHIQPQRKVGAGRTFWT